jgi:hypothetical protein
LFDFWLKVFAIAFGMGVVSGIVMAFRFGTNWSVLSDRTGPIQGPLLGYEVYTAFLVACRTSAASSIPEASPRRSPGSSRSRATCVRQS